MWQTYNKKQSITISEPIAYIFYLRRGRLTYSVPYFFLHNINYVRFTYLVPAYFFKLEYPKVVLNITTPKIEKLKLKG